MALHSALTGANLHESKGASTATNGQIAVANGSGAAIFTTPTLAISAPNVLATAAEVNRAADVSTRSVNVGSTLSVTELAHDGKTLLLNTLTGSVATLPAATQVGMRFKFMVSVLATSNSHQIKVANSSDIFQGMAYMVDSDTATTMLPFLTASDSDTITLNRSTTGSVTRGEVIEIECIATNVWGIKAHLTNTGTALTPFSATV